MTLVSQRPIRMVSNEPAAVSTCKVYNNHDISTAVNLGTLFAADTTLKGVQVECLTGTLYISLNGVAASASVHTAIRDPGQGIFIPVTGGVLAQASIFGTTAGIIPVYV